MYLPRSEKVNKDEVVFAEGIAECLLIESNDFLAVFVKIFQRCCDRRVVKKYVLDVVLIHISGQLIMGIGLRHIVRIQ